MFFDTHTHLGSRQFDSDLTEVIARARAAGVDRMLVPATDLPNARKCLEIAEQNSPGIRVATGIHPCDVDSVSGDAWTEELRLLARHPCTAAIGEIGLDYFHAPPRASIWHPGKPTRRTAYASSSTWPWNWA